MKKNYSLVLSTILMLFLTSCSTATTQAQPTKTVTVNPSFQVAVTAVPTQPLYRCGAWSSNNAPGTFSTITIYAKLTKTVEGISNATARAVVHFQSSDLTLDQQPASDSGGFVSFTLQLQGRQPRQVPATVDVIFSVAGKTVQCTPAFFTPV